MTLVFVYGTLTEPETVATVLPEAEFCGSATLRGLHRVEAAYPTLAPGGTVDGRLLSTDSLDELDRYEGTDRGLYVRISLPLARGESVVETYVGDPDRLGAAISWPGKGQFGERVAAVIDDSDVRVVPHDSSADTR